MQLPISKEVSDEGDVSIVDASGDPWFDGTGFGTEGAAADHIVKAVNSHELLVAACKAVIESANEFHRQSGISQDDEAICLKAVRAALAAAEAA